MARFTCSSTAFEVSFDVTDETVSQNLVYKELEVFYKES